MKHSCPTGHHPEPAHGCYTHHRCRCRGCTRINTAATAELRAVRLRLGRLEPGFVDPEPTRALVRWLHDQGATDRWIAEMAGLSEAAVSYIRRGRSSRGPLRATLTRSARAVERVARLVAEGEVQPPGYADAQRRKLERDRQRRIRVPA